MQDDKSEDYEDSEYESEEDEGFDFDAEIEKLENFKNFELTQFEPSKFKIFCEDAGKSIQD